MPYWALLVAALFGGFLSLPAFAVARQSIAALAPESHRLPAFALDSITTELSFMAGPALACSSPRPPARASPCTRSAPASWSPASGSGCSIRRSAAGRGAGVRERPGPPQLLAQAPPARRPGHHRGGHPGAQRHRRRGGRGAARLRRGRVDRRGARHLWAFSLLGGFAYGTAKRGLTPLTLFAPMALLTMPVGLGGEHWWLLALLLLPAGALCAPTITATADAVSRMTPAAARGEAMGLHNSALTVGVALGAPLAGVVMDWQSPPWGFAAVGGVGVLVALLVLPAELRNRRADRAEHAGDLELGLRRRFARRREPVLHRHADVRRHAEHGRRGPCGRVPPSADRRDPSSRIWTPLSPRRRPVRLAHRQSRMGGLLR